MSDEPKSKPVSKGGGEGESKGSLLGYQGRRCPRYGELWWLDKPRRDPSAFPTATPKCRRGGTWFRGGRGMRESWRIGGSSPTLYGSRRIIVTSEGGLRVFDPE